MSFGWSSNGGAAWTYQEDIVFLDSLAATLEKVKQGLQTSSLSIAIKSQTYAIHDPVIKMHDRLAEKFKSTLGRSNDKTLGRLLRSGPKKVEYALSVSEQVDELRRRIAIPLHDIQISLELQILTTVSSLTTDLSALSTNVIKEVESVIETNLSAYFAQSKNDKHSNLLQHVLRWLKPVSVEETLQDSLGGILRGSCEWLFNKPEYQSWLRSVETDECSRLLWITGIPGARKTTLAAHAIRRLREEHVVAYFFCDTKRAEAQEVVSILRTLSWQLLRQSHYLLDKVAEIYGSGAEPNIVNMEVCLSALLQAKPNRIIIVDGLDECDANSRVKICQHLAAISNKASVLIFSRDLIDISIALGKALGARQSMQLQVTEGDTEFDIKRFIEREVKLMNLSGENIERTVIATLQTAAQGMFQWADQMIKYLAEPGRIFAEEYLEALQDLPKGLDELYSRILATLHNNVKFRSRSKQLLQWLVCAQRPLTLSEIAAVLKLAIDQPRMPRGTILDNSSLKQAVSYCCGSLARISDVNGDTSIVTLVHASVKDFLLSSGHINAPFGDLLVEADTAHMPIAQSCLTYLCYEDIGFAPFKIEASQLEQAQDKWDMMSFRFTEYLKSFPLLEYAALNWWVHFKSAYVDLGGCKTLRRFYTSTKNTIKWLQVYLHCRGDQRAFRSSPGLGDITHIAGLQKYLLDGKNKFEIWLEHLTGPKHGRFVRWERFLDLGDANDFLPELHIAAFFDFADFLEERLLRGADVDQRTFERQTPLCLAARGDSVRSTVILLQFGADVNAKAWDGSTALCWAIDVECWTNIKRPGPFEVFPLLLEGRADPNLTYSAETPLYQACKIPFPDDPFVLDVVTSLLDHGATRYIDGHAEVPPPLSCAAELGALQLAQLLLKNGADVNGGLLGDAVQRSKCNPLLHICTKQQPNLKMVQMLLEAKANLNAVTLDRWNVLHFSSRGNIELTEMFLKYGAEVNVITADGSLPLHVAVPEDRDPIIKSLVDYGSSLDVEDEIGRTPLMIAVKNRYCEASKILIDAGARCEGEHWQIISTNDELKIRHKERIYWPLGAHDVSSVFRLLRFRVARLALPRSVALEILELAGYWLKSTSLRLERIMVDEQKSKLGSHTS